MKIRFISYLTIVLAALVLGACNSIMDDEVCADQPSTTATPVQIGFTLTTGEVSSRAEGTDEGTGYENYIDVEGKDFRILLFDANNTYLTTFEPTSIRPADNSQYPQTYYVEGELDQTYSNFKLVVLANWGDAYPTNLEVGTTKIEDVCTSTFSHTAPFTPSETQKIPMYGVKTCNTTLRPDLLTDLGQVDLLRAMAKIEVTCSADGFKLSEVKLHRYNTKGYCAPTGVYDDTKTDWGYDNNTACTHQIHIPTDTEKESDLPFTKTENGFIAYVPEFDNTEERNYIEVKLQHTDGSEVTLNSDPCIYFCEYDKETGKIRGDIIGFANEKYSEDETTVMFDPVDTWKRKELEKGTYTVRELLEPIFINGECVYKSDNVMNIRDYCTKEKETLSEENKRFVNPHPVHVDLSYELWDLKNEMINGGRVKKIGGMNHNA